MALGFFLGACSDVPPSPVASTSSALLGAPAWFERQKIVPPDPAYRQFFGEDLALSGNTAVVGVGADSEKGASAGGAYVLVRGADGAWSQQQKLTAPDAAPGDSFGSAVAVFGDRVLIGAPGDDDNGPDSGSAYLFTRLNSAWTLEKKLLPSATTHESDGVPSAGDLFGASVALDGDSAVVGAPHHMTYADAESGALFVFTLSASVWSQQRLYKFGGGKKTHIGRSLALANGVLVYSPEGSASAVVTTIDWVTKEGATWPGSAHGRGVAPPGGGSALAISESYTAVSMPNAVNVFRHDTANTPLVATLTASDSGFGSSIALSGNTLLVGTYLGAVYVFTAAGDSSWTQTQKLTALDGMVTDIFGSALAISGSSALVGAPSRIENGIQSGVVYAEEFGEGFTNGKACLAGSQCQSGFCVEKVCCDAACTGNGCRSCLAKNTGQGDGTCANVTAGSDPFGVCPSSPAATCKATGVCDGQGACQAAYPKGTVCGPAACFNSTSVLSPAECDGAGSCVTDVKTAAACIPGYTCQTNACVVSCGSNAACDVQAGYACIGGRCRLPASGSAGSGGSDGGSGGDDDHGAPSGAGGSAGETTSAPGGAGDAATAGSGGAGHSGASGEAMGGAESMNAGNGAGGAAASGANSDPGEGGQSDAPSSPSDLSSTACGCRVAGGSNAPRGVFSLALALISALALRRGRSEPRTRRIATRSLPKLLETSSEAR